MGGNSWGGMNFDYQPIAGPGSQNYLGGGENNSILGQDFSGTATGTGDNLWAQDWNQLGSVGKLGVVSQGLGAFSNLANIYAGFKAMSLQKKQFQFAKDAWNKNYNNQVKDYENTLKDRWAARNASAGARGGSYESMGSWVGSRAMTGQAPGQAPVTHSSAQSFYSNNQPADRQAATPQQRYATGG